MTSDVNNEIMNLNATAQVILGSVGMAMLETVLLLLTLSPLLIAVATLVAVYTVLTAITAWDPINALVRISRRRSEVIKTGIPSHLRWSKADISRVYNKAA
jgi:hypothetical protein